MEYPFIAINTRRGRIRLSKRSYDELQNPQFIKILINPVKMQIGIQKANMMTPEASRVHHAEKDHGHTEVYCPGLVHDITERYQWKDKGLYRLAAQACINNEVLVFSLRNPALKNGIAEDSHEVQADGR